MRGDYGGSWAVNELLSSFGGGEGLALQEVVSPKKNSATRLHFSKPGNVSHLCQQLLQHGRQVVLDGQDDGELGRDERVLLDGREELRHWCGLAERPAVDMKVCVNKRIAGVQDGQNRFAEFCMEFYPCLGT